DEKNRRRDSVEAVASQKGHLHVLRWLHYAHNRPLDHSNVFGTTLVCWAAKNGHINVLSWLWKHGADMNKPDLENEYPVMYAAQYGSLLALKWYHRHGYDILAQR